MLYHIFHSTQFTYQQWVSFSHNLIRLKSRDTLFQTVVDFSLSTDPSSSELEGYIDYFGNHLYHMLIREPHHHLKVTARTCIAMDMQAIEQHRILGEYAKDVSYGQALQALESNTPDVIDAKQFCMPSLFLKKVNPLLRDYASSSFSRERSVYESVEEFMGRIYNDFQFVSGFSDVNTPVETVFEARKGVCQDFAHIAISALRSLGLAVRYMSGYIETLPPLGEEKLFGADASHAWFSVFIPGYGWFDFDPTNNVIPYDRHIVLGYGPDYADIAPIQGVVFGSGRSNVRVTVDVTREEIAEQSQSQS
ncbi:MAG: transglutaminase family protein [Epsilonproteobacteria bacterium]|nr:transglutaminase family protein [Campylobacterota bacterium]